MEPILNTSIHFVVNPNASNGRCGKAWERLIEPELVRRGVPARVHRTAAVGGGARIACELAEQDAPVVISVGGDGTHNEVSSGLLRAGRIPEGPQIGFLTLGTGGDWRKTLGLPVDPLVQLEAILSDLDLERCRRLDLGRIRYVDHAGVELERAFINIASLGLAGEVDERVNRTTKALGGFASFLIGTLRATLSYRPRTVSLRLDGEDLGEFRILNVAAANGRYFGGGMHVAPGARPDDGLLDIIVMEAVGIPGQLAMAPRLYAGTHVDLPHVQVLHGRLFEATSKETVLLDVDGEALGRLPAAWEILPEALRVVGSRIDG